MLMTPVVAGNPFVARYERRMSIIIERWLSRALGHVLLESRESADQRVTYRMYDIDRTDPGPELFLPRQPATARGIVSRIADSVLRSVRNAKR